MLTTTPSDDILGATVDGLDLAQPMPDETFGTLHRGIADDGPDEHRLMRRCQVLGTKIFDPACRRAVSLPASTA